MALFRILPCFSQKWWNERERRRKSFNPISAFISRLQIKTPFKDFFSRFTLMDDGLKGELKDSSFSFLIYSVTTGTKSGKQNTLNSFSSYSRIPSEIAPVPTVKRSNIWPRHHHFFLYSRSLKCLRNAAFSALSCMTHRQLKFVFLLFIIS